MNAKTILSQDKKLLAWWSSVVGDSRFDQIMLILKADSFEASPAPEQMTGVTNFISSMSTIIDSEAAPTAYASPGLSHDLDIKRRVVTQPEVKQAEKPKKK